MSFNFLSHDMNPVDPVEQYGPRRRHHTASSIPARPQREGPRPESITMEKTPRESTLVFQNGTRRIQVRDHFNPGGMFFDGAPRPDPPPSAPASLHVRAPRIPAEPIPNGSSSLYFGVAPPRHGSTAPPSSDRTSTASSQFGMKRNDWFGNDTDALKEQRLRSQSELQRYQEQQLRELADRRRRDSEERRQNSGWILDKDFSPNRQRSARIQYQISEPVYNQKTMNGVPESAKLKSFVDPVHKDLSEKDREYMSDILRQREEENQRRLHSQRAARSLPEKTMEDLVRDHMRDANPRIPSDINALLYGPSMDPETKREKHEEYNKFLARQVETFEKKKMREPETRVYVDPNAPRLRKPDSDEVKYSKVTDDGHLSKLYESHVKTSKDLIAVLNEKKTPNPRIIKPLTDDDQRKSQLQQERQAVLAELRAERESLQRKLNNEEKVMKDMHFKNDPFVYSRPNPSPTHRAIRDDALDDMVQNQKYALQQEYYKDLESERQHRAQTRAAEYDHEIQERREAARSSPWKWNMDHVNHLQRSSTLPITASDQAPRISDGHPHTRITSQLMMERRPDDKVAREYYADLEKMSKETQERRYNESMQRKQSEKEHLDHSLDVALIKSRQYKHHIPIHNPDFYDHKGHVPDVFERTALAHQQHPIPLKNPDFLDRTGHVPEVLNNSKVV